MTEAIQNEAGWSLADLAGMDTSEVAAITSLIPAVGVYTCKGLEVKGGQREKQDDKPPLFYFNFVGEILEAKLVNKDIDTTKLVGRKLTESFTLWPSNFRDLIGLLKGRYKTIGLPNEGARLGGVDGQEPGWLDNWVNHVYKVRVSHFMQGGEPRARFTYLKPDGSDEPESAAAA